MSLTLPLIVYGSGTLYRELFNAIAAVMHASGYRSLIHLSILLTGTWAIVRYSVQRSLGALGKWLAAYYAAFFVMFMPVATIEILDQVNQGKAYAVDNVPLGIAVMASYTSRIGAGLTELTDAVFSLPDDLKYSQTGMVMGSRLVLNASQFQLTDPNFMESMQGFVHQCVFYDLLLNKTSLKDLMSQQNLWGYLSETASPARAFLYYPLQGSTPSVMTCKAGAVSLSRDWQAALTQTAAHYGARLFPQASDPKAQLLTYLPEAYRFLTQTSQSAADIFQQNLMANALQNGLLQMSATTNAPAALENYALARAQLQKRLSNETVGDMAAYWLPLMKNVLEALLYGSFIFVFLLLMFPFGASVLKQYLGSLLWLQMWAPLYAVLNLFMNFYAQSKTQGAMGGMGLSLYSQAGIAQVNADVASLAGYLSLSIPLLARGVVSGMSSVFAQAAQYIAGVTQGAAVSASGEAASGNFSLGNVNYQNQSSFNTSAHHFDASGRVSSGMYTAQTDAGSTLTMTPDGSLVMNNQGAISQLGVNVNLAQSLRSSYMQQAEKAETAGFNQLSASSESTASAIRNLYELGKHNSNAQTSGESWSDSTQTAMSHAANQVYKLTDQFAQSHNISFGEASAVLGNASAEGKLGAKLGPGINIGVSAGASRSSSQTDSTEKKALYNDAKNFVTDSGFAHNLDIAERASHDKSYRTSDEIGNRLIDNSGASFDQAQALRQEAGRSFQQAQTYRQSASLAEENAVNINSNASQVVFNALREQGMSPQEIENLVVNHPETAIAQASKAVDAYKQTLEQGWQQGLVSSPEAVTQAYNQPHPEIKTKDDIKNNAHDERLNVEKQAAEQKLKDIPLDKSAQSEVAQKIKANTQKIEQARSGVNQKGIALEAKVKHEEQRKRAGSALKEFFTGIDTDEHNKD